MSEVSLVEDIVELINVYPNPSKDRFFIRLNESFEIIQPFRVDIYDAQGRSVIDLQVSEKNFEVDLSVQPNGLYFLKTSIRGKKMNVKLLKY